MGASILEKQDLMAQEAICMRFMSSIYGIEVILRQHSLQSLPVIEAVTISMIRLIGAELSCTYIFKLYMRYVYIKNTHCIPIPLYPSLIPHCIQAQKFCLDAANGKI